jgi:hypothetical protein
MSAHKPFWENANELRAFMRYLYLLGWFDTEAGMLTFLEEPWKYRPEYRTYHSSKKYFECSKCQKTLEPSL